MITCETVDSDSDGALDKFQCTGTVDGIGTYSPTTGEQASDSVQIVANLSSSVTDTTSWRCSVEVGDGDDVATDTQLVYAQKISLGYSKSDELTQVGDELYVIAGKSVQVTVYGDDKYPLANGTCAEGEGEETVNSKSANIMAETDTEWKCSLMFSADEVKDPSLTVELPTDSFTVVESCGAGTYFDATAPDKCVSCATTNMYRAADDDQFTGCKQCGAGMQATDDNDACGDCQVGWYSTGSTSCTACAAGTYNDKEGSSTCTPCRVGMYINEVGQSACKDCAEGYYAPTTGMTECLMCYGDVQNQGSGCSPCSAGKRFDKDKHFCEDCGEGQWSHGSSMTCFACAPGQMKGANGCEDCPAGTKQPDSGKETCIDCSSTLGEYQTQAGQSYCRVAEPGYSLDEKNVTKNQAICAKNTYSTGGAESCLPCNAENNEYTEGQGATYCTTCRTGLDGDGNCETVYCQEDVVEIEGIGTGTFTFTTSTTGVVKRVACNNATGDDQDPKDEYITRGCNYNSVTRSGEWDSEPNSLACSSAVEEEVNAAVDAIKTVNIADANATEAATQSLKELTTANATQMSAKDYSNIASSLGDISTSLLESEDVVMDESSATNLADSVGAVVGSGAGKLESVSAEDKDKMVSCVTVIASKLTPDAEVKSETIAMKKFSSLTVAEPVDLPTPTNITVTAPKLTLNKDFSSPPSVAVFSKEAAAAIFPTPEASSESSDAVAGAVTTTIDSAIVSLEFTQSASNEALEFAIDISVDTSQDSSHASNIQLERLCKFYDTSASKWSTEGCTTAQSSSGSGEATYACTCNHNTSFAIVLSATEIADTSQSDATNVLMPINIVFLFITFMCMAPFKQFRARRLMQIQTQLCLSLFIGHIVFLVVGTFDPDGAACVPGVVIAQYFFLVSIAWSVCASVTLYEKIVNALKSYGKQDKHYFVKCLAGCWFCPVFLVVATYLTAWQMNEASMPYLTSNGLLDGDNVKVCWVGMPWKLVGFMIPIYLCLVLNLVLFVMIGRIIIKAGKNGSSTGHAREVKALLSISTTVGLPWLVIIFAVGAAAGFFQWLFIIVTALQGPTMFVCFVIFQEDVLTNLFGLVGKQPPGFLVAPKSAKSTKSTAAASEISTVKPTSAVAPAKTEPKKELPETPKEAPVEDNIYSKVDEEAAVEADNVSSSSKNHYETTNYTQHGDEAGEGDPPPAVEPDETYENGAAEQNMGPHVPQLV